MSTTKTLRVTYEVEHEVVTLRWNHRFGSRHHLFYNHLPDHLEGIEGVENVSVRSYSAQIEFAPHVTTAERVIEGVEEVFMRELSPWLAEQFGLSTITLGPFREPVVREPATPARYGAV